MLPSLKPKKSNVNKDNYLRIVADEAWHHNPKAHEGEKQLQKLFKNAFVIDRPLDEVGGDGYWLYDSGDKIFLIVFDCSGYGRMANMMSRRYIVNIKNILEKEKCVDPGEILFTLHQKLMIQFRGLESHRFGCGADIGVLAFNPGAGYFEYCGAKMKLLIIADQKIEWINGGRQQLGDMFDSIHIYTTQKINIASFQKQHAYLYLFSDGITNLMGGGKNKKMGSKRLTDVLITSSNLKTIRAKKYIEKELSLWQGENQQQDDMLLIGLEI